MAANIKKKIKRKIVKIKNKILGFLFFNNPNPNILHHLFNNPNLVKKYIKNHKKTHNKKKEEAAMIDKQVHQMKVAGDYSYGLGVRDRH